MIRLVGHGQLNVTTQVFEEAANRVSRYLRVQLMVNVSYGLPVGIALYLIGIPNAALWGVLATALRFIPYLGAWIAAALPIALAFAISDDWSLVVWTVAVFVVLELISNNVIEPWAYGASTGMSALAVIVAAIFWTWLWGAVGLLLAVPLTVCLVVVGRYIPQFSFLSIMLGDQPVLSLQDRIYQRLLARDQEEAAELAEEYVGEKGLEALYEDVLIPVLDLAERDRHSDALSEERTRFVFDSTRTLAEDLDEHPDEEKEPTESAEAKDAQQPEAPLGPISACIVPARDEADEIVGAMLRRCLARRKVAAELLTIDVLKSEVMDRLTELAPQVLYVSALPPAAVLHASYFCKRLRPRFPAVKDRGRGVARGGRHGKRAEPSARCRCVRRRHHVKRRDRKAAPGGAGHRDAAHRASARLGCRRKSHELGTFDDLITDGVQNFADDAVRWSDDRVLHFHRFHHQQRRAAFDARAGGRMDRDQLAGHRRGQLAGFDFGCADCAMMSASASTRCRPF